MKFFNAQYHGVNFPMKNIAIISFLLLALLGCSGNYGFRGVKLLNLKTNESVIVKSMTATGPPAIVSSPIDDKFFYYVYREGDHIKLEKHGFSGVLIDAHNIPSYARFYGEPPQKLIPSPDGNQIVYIKDESEGLHLYDLSTKSEESLCENVFSNVYSIEGMFWMNSTTFVVLFGRDKDFGREVGEIVKIDVPTRKVTARLEIKDLQNHFDFSSANMLLAIAPWTGGGGIKIIDMQKMKIVDEIAGSMTQSWAGNSPVGMKKPGWNRDGTKLAYVDFNNILSVYSLKDRMSTPLKELPKNGVVYIAKYINESTYVTHYSEKNDGSRCDDFHFIDLNSKQDTIISFPDFWGNVEFLDNGNVMVYVTQ